MRQRRIRVRRHRRANAVLSASSTSRVAAVVAIVAVGLVAGCGEARRGVARPARLPCTALARPCGVSAVVGWKNAGRAIVFVVSIPGERSRLYRVGIDSTGLRESPGAARRSARVWTRSRDRFARVEAGRIAIRTRSGRLLGSPTDECPTERACYDSVDDSDPSWSPDGRWVLFTRSVFDVCGFCLVPGVSNSAAIGVAHPDGSRFHWVTERDGDTSGAWSPDGRWIAFVRNEWLLVVEVDRGGHPLASPRPVVIP